MATPQENPGSPAPADALVITFPDDSSSPREKLLWGGVLALLTLVVYWPITQGSFLWNDDVVVSQNRLMMHDDGLRKIWIDRWADPRGYSQHQYHPFTDTVYWIQFQLFGHARDGTISPVGFHITNMVLAAGATIVLWLILQHLKVPGAWLAAALFAVHPLNTEAIAWISQLSSVLSGLLCLASVYCFLRFMQEDQNARSASPNDPATKWGFYAASVLIFVLAMLSKSTAFAMPFVMLLILWWKRRWKGQYIALLMPMVLIGLLIAFSEADFQRTIPGVNDVNLSAGQRLVLASRAAWFYAGKLLLPVHLTFLYPKWAIDTDAGHFLPLVAIVLLLIGLLAAQKYIGLGPIVAVVAFGFCLLPSLGFYNQYPMRLTYVADHNAYLASAALIPLLVATGAWLLRRVESMQVRVNSIIGISALILIIAGAVAWSRVNVFVTDLSLWQDTVTKNPDSYFAHDRYAVDLGAQADELQNADNPDDYTKAMQQAMDEAKTAARLNPNDAEAESIIGRLYLRQKDLVQATAHLTRATELDPNLYDAWQDLATTLIAQKQYQLAITKLDDALRLAPQSSPVHRLLGEAYAGLDDKQRAASEFRLALQIKPDNYPAREDYGNLLALAGKIKEAKFQYTQILEAQKRRADIWVKVGVLCTAENNMKEAATYFKAALDIDPTMELAKQNLELANKMLKQQAATQHATTTPTTQR